MRTTLFRVHAFSGPAVARNRQTSEGFSTRAAAERFATGLAQSGRCDQIMIEPYETEETEASSADMARELQE